MARLEEGHRSHPEAREPCSSRVSRDVICGNGGTCQNELSRFPPIIHRTTDVIPDRRFYLPLVDETRHLPVEYEGGMHRDSLASIPVHIEKHFARSELPGRGCLATCLGAFDDDRPCRREATGQFIVDHTSSVHDTGLLSRTRRPGQCNMNDPLIGGLLTGVM